MSLNIAYLKGILHQKILDSNGVWYSRFGRRGLKTTETWKFWSQFLSPGVLRCGAPGVSRHSTRAEKSKSLIQWKRRKRGKRRKKAEKAELGGFGYAISLLAKEKIIPFFPAPLCTFDKIPSWWYQQSSGHIWLVSSRSSNCARVQPPTHPSYLIFRGLGEKHQCVNPFLAECSK